MASLDDAIRRLDTALGLLEASINRRLDLERRRGDLETELQIMQDDRARLAVELDGTASRLAQVEAARDDAGQRVHRAMGSIREVLDRADTHEA